MEKKIKKEGGGEGRKEGAGGGGIQILSQNLKVMKCQTDLRLEGCMKYLGGWKGE